MSFPSYPAYKPSDVEWLGEVPEHWGVMRLSRKLEKMPCYGVLVPEYVDEGVPMLRITDIEDGLTSRDNLKKISTRLSAEYSRTLLEKGDIALAVVGTIGRSLIVDELLAGCNLSRAVAKVRTDKDLSSRMLRWIFESLLFKRFTDLVCVGTAQRVLNMNTLASFYIAIPSTPEQLSIDLFLDRETAKIDTLIAEQQCLIELLQEKRQAVISHAVTKGLNPNAPMKDSGVEWLGEVPEHWAVAEARREIDFLTSGSRGWAEFYSENGYLFLRIGNLTRDGIDLDLEDIQRVSPPEGAEGARTEVREGDVLFSITAYLGSVAVVPQSLERAYVSQHVCLARLNGKNLLPKWLAYSVLSVSGRAYLEAESYGGTKLQLSLDDIKSFPLAIPSLEEQRLIIEDLEDSLAGLKGLKSDCKESIVLLQERRSALISAAVTGQIDVRGLVETESSEE